MGFIYLLKNLSTNLDPNLPVTTLWRRGEVPRDTLEE
jgi:hypothetical protein